MEPQVVTVKFCFRRLYQGFQEAQTPQMAMQTYTACAGILGQSAHEVMKEKEPHGLLECGKLGTQSAVV